MHSALRCGTGIGKRLFLWTLFVVQVCLIGGIFLFGVRPNHWHRDATNNNRLADAQPSSAVIIPSVGVEFVRRRNRSSDLLANGDDGDDFAELQMPLSIIGRYEDEFVGRAHCFRDGLAKRPKALAPTETNDIHACVCKPEYHGSDCGQPEVIWRAFMLAKIPLRLAAISRRRPHMVAYLVHTPHPDAVLAQLETLETQLLELAHVVDVFALCAGRQTRRALRRSIRTGPLKPIARRVAVLVSSTDDDGGCELRTMYAQLRRRFANASADDVLLVSGPDEILNWRAVKYFKWYDHWPQPVQFRLKYLVYGYYWQHASGTRLSAGAGQLSLVDEVHRGDPLQLVRAAVPGMIIGDLNHVGGWFCEYCNHPMNIARRLLADRTNATASRTIEAGEVERFVASGLYVDGREPLQRRHRFADKYYAPESVRNASWRYESVLSNVYATYDDDTDDEFGA